MHDYEIGKAWGDEMAIPGVPKPRRILEWAVDQTRKVRLGGFEPRLVDHTFTSPTTGLEVTVPAMRLYVREADGEAGEWEWMMLSKQGMTALNELLARPDWRDLLLEVTRQGAPPKTQWIVRVLK